MIIMAPYEYMRLPYEGCGEGPTRKLPRAWGQYPIGTLGGCPSPIHHPV